MRPDQVKIGVQDVRLCDDGSMDTVVEWWCEACHTWHEIRYDGETAADYRDQETGALDLKAFFNGVMLGTIDNEPAHWLEVIGDRHLMYSTPAMMEADECEACGKPRPDGDEEREYLIEDWLDATDRHRAWEVFDKGEAVAEPLRVTLCPTCAERMRDGALTLFVNVYLEDQAYGGPEEGGWWYSVGSVEMIYPVSCLKDAVVLKQHLTNGEYSNADRPSMYHTNSEGEYRVCIQLRPGRGWPTHRPHYE